MGSSSRSPALCSHSAHHAIKMEKKETLGGDSGGGKD